MSNIFIHKKRAPKLYVFEFIGEFENDEVFDADFNPITNLLIFKNFTLQGKRIKKEFTLFEKENDNISTVATVDEIVLFDKEPRFNIDN